MTAEEIKCELCGRKLLTEQSRRRGRGPHCDEKVSPHAGRDHSPRRRSARLPHTVDEDTPSLLDELEPGP